MHSLPVNGTIVYREDYTCIIEPQNGKGGIYIGNLQAAQNLKTLKKLGIRAVLTAARGIDLTHAKSDIPFYLQVPGEDRDAFDLTKYFPQSINFIRDALQTTNIMVHCLAGVSRSVCLVLAYLIKHRGLSYDDAYALVKSKRSMIHPNDGFINQLKKFEAQTRANTVSPTKYGTIQSRIERQSSSPSKKRYEYNYLSKQYEGASKIDRTDYPYQRNRTTICSCYMSPTKKPLIDIDNYRDLENCQSPKKRIAHQVVNESYENRSKQMGNSPQKHRYNENNVKQYKQIIYDEPDNTSAKYQFVNDQYNYKFNDRNITPDRRKWLSPSQDEKKSINDNPTKLFTNDIQTQRLFGNYDRLRHTSTAELCQELDNKIAAIRQKYSQYTKSQLGKSSKPINRQPQPKSHHYRDQNSISVNTYVGVRKKVPEYQSITSKANMGEYGVIKKCMDRSAVGLGLRKLNSLRQGYC